MTTDQITLFCIPHAGSSAAGFHKWRRLLDPSIVCTPLELSGRGSRVREPLYPNFDAAVDDVVAQLQAKSSVRRYAIFGHSLGALLAFEVAHCLHSVGCAPPEHIFFSATRPPSRKLTGELLHAKSNDEFIAAIAAHGGLPDPIREHHDMLAFFTPNIKSDYRLYELYEFTPKAEPLTCPISVLLGDRDSLATAEELPLWSKFTTGSIHSHIFAGAGHFFVDERREEVVRYVNGRLT